MEGKRFSRRALWLAFAACYLSASCVLSPRQKETGPQQWSRAPAGLVSKQSTLALQSGYGSLDQFPALQQDA